MSVQALWREVLLIALTDALHGVPANTSIDDVRHPMDARLRLRPECRLRPGLPAGRPGAAGGAGHLQDRLTRLGSGRPPRTWRDLAIGLKPKLPSEPFYTYQGSSLTLPEWAEVLGVPRPLLMNRVNCRGWSVERALTEPVGRRMPKPSRGDQEQVRTILRELQTFETDVTISQFLAPCRRI